MTEVDSNFVDWFRSTAPYIRVHRGKTFVIQFDDKLVYGDYFTDFVHDLALLNGLGINLVLVFGARESIESWLRENNEPSNFHDDLRITNAETMDLVKSAAGKLRFEIESRLSMGLGNTPMSNAELIVSSGNFVRARPAGIVNGIDYQFTGKVRSIDGDAIQAKLAREEIILLPPLGFSVTGETYNMNAINLASDVAAELQADKLIYLVHGDGLLDQDDAVIRQLVQAEAETMLAEGKLENNLHVRAGLAACGKGVPRVQFIDADASGSLLQELFTRDGVGTMISATSYDEIRGASVDDIAAILDLIEPLEKQGVLVERSREKLELEIEHFTLLLRDNVIIGCAALYPFPNEKSVELACFAIHPEYHGLGMGVQLLELMEKTAADAGMQSLFVLTTQAEHWFLENGFAECELEDLPVEKKQLYNYQRKSRVLTRSIGS